MSLGNFAESRALSMGVELELQIVNLHDFDLSPGSAALLRLVGKRKLPGLVTPEITDIRGPGFMVAVEFANPTNHEPDAGFTTRVRVEAQKRGLILLTCGVYGNVVRFLAPITIPDAHFSEAMDILEAAVAAARQA